MDGLLIGRFQPFHLGHVHAVRFALSRTGRLWLGIGSSNRPPERSNPFSAAEREEMIESSIPADIRGRIRIYSIPDTNDHEKWIKSIDSIVPAYDVVFSNDALTRHVYHRHGIDVLPIPFHSRGDLSGTNVRDRIALGRGWDHLVPGGTRDVLEKIGAKDRLGRL